MFICKWKRRNTTVFALHQQTLSDRYAFDVSVNIIFAKDRKRSGNLEFLGNAKKLLKLSFSRIVKFYLNSTEIKLRSFEKERISHYLKMFCNIQIL